MKTLQELANELTTSLDLSIPPVALATCDTLPPDVPWFKGVVPAGCVFWQEASSRTFATSANDHSMCSIGTHTHRLAGASAPVQSELAETLKAMAGLDYVREDEVSGIPVMRRQIKHVVYGPLKTFPVTPEVVFLFAHARQGLILSEAITRVDGALPVAMGRPACAVVPQVINHGAAAMSLGCCGARAYMEAMSDDAALWALPGNPLQQYCEEITALSRANRTLTRFHEMRRQDVASGRRPTVRESLERL